MKLTNKQRDALEQLANGAELTEAHPGGWWIGNNRISGRVGMFLLRYCLIRKIYDDTEVKGYIIGEDGTGVLNDEKYVPRIVKERNEEPLCP
jgi:hypothetical protein